MNLVAAPASMPQVDMTVCEHSRDILGALDERATDNELVGNEPVRELVRGVREAGEKERERLRRPVLAEFRAGPEDLGMAGEAPIKINHTYLIAQPQDCAPIATQ
jgi:hypothetical protein